MIPRGRAQERLQSLSILVVAIGDCFGVFSFHVGQQSAQIALGMFSLFRPPQPHCEGFGELVQSAHHSLKYCRMHLAIGQQFRFPQLKTSFHRLSPFSSTAVRKVLIQNNLRLVNAG
jgi:hypothetical protein